MNSLIVSVILRQGGRHGKSGPGVVEDSQADDASRAGVQLEVRIFAA
jgi:hypothetical protein